MILLRLPRLIPQVYLRDLPSGSELSFEYEFLPDARLEPRDFVVALTVVYHDNKGNYFSNTFFNNTIEIIEIKKMIDWELIFLFLILGALAAGAGEAMHTHAWAREDLHGGRGGAGTHANAPNSSTCALTSRPDLSLPPSRLPALLLPGPPPDLHGPGQQVQAQPPHGDQQAR